MTCDEFDGGERLQQESVVEDAAIAWLEELGCIPQSRMGHIARNRLPERTSFRDVVLVERYSAIQRLNPAIPTTPKGKPFERVLRVDTPSLTQTNRLPQDAPHLTESGQIPRPDEAASCDHARLAIDFAPPTRMTGSR
jgi:type I restriction enzyme R subunit